MDDICAICLEDFEDNNYAILRCKHKFHLHCFVCQALTTEIEQHKCPLCRGDVFDENKKEEIINILDKVYENIDNNTITEDIIEDFLANADFHIISEIEDTRKHLLDAISIGLKSFLIAFYTGSMCIFVYNRIIKNYL